MTVAVFGAKAAVAMLLLVAGGAKLADLDGFAVAVGLLVPGRLTAAFRLPRRALTVAAIAIAGGELLIGAVSLCWPALRWMNLVVLALACGFTAIAVAGYARHRGRPCRCFGALTRRGFGPRALAQALLTTGAASLATSAAGPTQLQLGLGAHLLLLAAAGITALAAYTAAGALAAGQARPGMAG